MVKTKQKEKHNPAIRTIFLISVVAVLAVILVRKEVQVDETTRAIRNLEIELVELIGRITQAQAELQELSASPQVLQIAGNIGLQSVQAKTTVINIVSGDIPLEFRRDFVLLKADSSNTQSTNERQ